MKFKVPFCVFVPLLRLWTLWGWFPSQWVLRSFDFLIWWKRSFFRFCFTELNSIPVKVGYPYFVRPSRLRVLTWIYIPMAAVQVLIELLKLDEHNFHI